MELLVQHVSENGTCEVGEGGETDGMQRGWEVLSDLSIGCDQNVRVVRVREPQTERTLIVKIPRRERDKIDRQVWASGTARRAGVPVAAVVAWGEGWMIEEMCGSMHLHSWRTALDHSRRQHEPAPRRVIEMYERIGTWLSRLHREPVVNAPVCLRSSLSFEETRSWLTQTIVERYNPHVNAQSPLTVGEWALVEAWMGALLAQVDADALVGEEWSMVPVHLDVADDNVVVGADACSCSDDVVECDCPAPDTFLIDFGDADVGEAAADFRQLYEFHHGTTRWEAIMRGYFPADTPHREEVLARFVRRVKYFVLHRAVAFTGEQFGERWVNVIKQLSSTAV